MEFATWLEEEEIDSRYFIIKSKPKFLGVLKRKQLLLPRTKTYAGLLQKLKAHLKQGKIDPVEYKKLHAIAQIGYEKELDQQKKRG